MRAVGLGCVLITLIMTPTGTALCAGAALGRIEGTVTLNRRLAAGPMRFNLYPDAADASSSHAAHHAKTDERRNVVVYLETVPSMAAAPGPATPLVIRQEDETFVPHVLPIVKGETVQFVNGDPLYHNVFSLSRAATFDLGRLPRDASKSIRFDLPGAVKVFCHIHSDMSAIVLVLENAFFTVPDADGHFALSGVPPGDYTMIAWHERAKPVVKSVHVEAGATTALDLSVPVTEGDQ